MDCKLSSPAIYSALKADGCKVAEKLLERMDSSFGPRRLMELSEYYVLKTLLAIFRGDPGTTSLHAEASLNSLIEVGSSFFLGLRYLSKAHVPHRSELNLPLRQKRYASPFFSKNHKFFIFFRICKLSVRSGVLKFKKNKCTQQRPRESKPLC